MENLKNLNLTERDFEILVEALEFLPNKGDAGEIVGDLLTGLFLDAKDEKMQTFKKEMELKKIEAKKNKESVKEDVQILAGKLLMFKRFLKSEGLLEKTNEILKFENDSEK